MALYDNKQWLLSHIRNSFISTDDTGMCELVMTGEDLSKHQTPNENYISTSESDEEDDIERESFDIPHDMEFGLHRQRSNTAVRLEKLDQAQRKAAKNVKWDNSQKNIEDEDMFVKKEVKPNAEVKKSLFVERLEHYTSLPQNPYIQYAKFDGSTQVGVPVRKYKIFLTFLPEEQRNYPMQVTCVATAKIQDLIGLICLKCSKEHGDHPMQPTTNYGLYITEEDGEVDRDFPCLDPKELVAKFGFTSLGLVEHKNQRNVFFADTTPPPAIQDSPSTTKIDHFHQMTADKQMRVHKNAMEAPLYQSFKVFVVTKVRAKVEVNLGVSGEKLEIDPVQQKGAKFVLVKQKPVSHDMDSVAWCDVSEVKGSRTVFRVVYSLSFGGSRGGVPGENAVAGSGYSPSMQSSASFKHYDFEADHTTAEEIVQKINLILDIRSSASRKEYLASKEKKHHKKKYLHLK